MLIATLLPVFFLLFGVLVLLKPIVEDANRIRKAKKRLALYDQYEARYATLPVQLRPKINGFWRLEASMLAEGHHVVFVEDLVSGPRPTLEELKVK